MLNIKSNLRQQLLNKYLIDHADGKFNLLQKNNDIILDNLLLLLTSLLQNLELKAPIIGIYWPLKYEPDLLKLVVSLTTTRSSGMNNYNSPHIALPKVANKNMFFVKYSVDSKLERTGFKSKIGDIFHPTSNVEIIPNILVIPGVAFSVAGYRLGLGKGYYDKYLTKHTQTNNITTIGVGFHDQLLEYLPVELHDHKINYIVTDKILLKL